ncbi:MAG: hypothetical protein ABUK01_01550 [Leptospirales bacterium]
MDSDEKKRKKKLNTIFTVVGILSVSIAAAVFTVVSMKIAGVRIHRPRVEMTSTTSGVKVSVDREGKILPELFTTVKIGIFPVEKCNSMVINLSVEGDLQLNGNTTNRYKLCDEVIHPVDVKVEQRGYGILHVDIDYESDKGTISAKRTFPYHTWNTDVPEKEKQYGK